MVVPLDSPQGRRTIRETLLQSILPPHHLPSKSRKYPSGGVAALSVGDVSSSDDDMMEEMVEIAADTTKNVLILMSDTGGGHRASAEAIRDSFRLQFGDHYKVFVKDVWKEHAGWPLNDMERSYKFMVKHNQLWKVAFHSTSPRWVHRFYLAAMAAVYAKEVQEGMMKYKPDIIISVHPLMQHIPLWVLQGLNKKVVFITVVTDLNTCHPTWFHKSVTRCYCPSEEVSKRAFAQGLVSSQVKVFGLPIRPSFCRPLPSKKDLRAELQMDPDLPAVLLMGGGDGMGPVKQTALALSISLSSPRPLGQIIIICGRNLSLLSSLQAHPFPIPTIIRGFEPQIETWMSACDCIVTKAGPGTIAESLIKGLPIVLNGFIPGQEVGNVPYVVQNGAGVFSNSPEETGEIVARWFSGGSDEMRDMSENASRLAQPDAVNEIVKDIDDLVRRRGRVERGEYL